MLPYNTEPRGFVITQGYISSEFTTVWKYFGLYSHIIQRNWCLIMLHLHWTCSKPFIILGLRQAMDAAEGAGLSLLFVRSAPLLVHGIVWRKVRPTSNREWMRKETGTRLHQCWVLCKRKQRDIYSKCHFHPVESCKVYRSGFPGLYM